LVEDFFLGNLHLIIGSLLKVLNIIIIKGGTCGGNGLSLCAALQDLKFPQPLLKALTAPAKRLVDRLRRRCESPLEDREGKPNSSRPLVVGKGLRPIELFAYIFSDFLIESRLRL
jgi:hypothetical protein